MQHLKIGQRYIHQPKQKHDVEIFFKNDLKEYGLRQDNHFEMR
jgi:hypothetical protein